MKHLVEFVGDFRFELIDEILYLSLYSRGVIEDAVVDLAKIFDYILHIYLKFDRLLFVKLHTRVLPASQHSPSLILVVRFFFSNFPFFI